MTLPQTAALVVGDALRSGTDPRARLREHRCCDGRFGSREVRCPAPCWSGSSVDHRPSRCQFYNYHSTKRCSSPISAQSVSHNHFSAERRPIVEVELSQRFSCWETSRSVPGLRVGRFPRRNLLRQCGSEAVPRGSIRRCEPAPPVMPPIPECATPSMLHLQ